MRRGCVCAKRAWTIFYFFFLQYHFLFLSFNAGLLRTPGFSFLFFS